MEAIADFGLQVFHWFMRGAKTSAWTMKSLPGTALITCKPVQPGCKQLIWSAHKPRFKSTLARLHLPKLWFLDIVQWPCAPWYLFFEDAALCQCKEALPWTQVTIKLCWLQQTFIFYLCPPSLTFATMLHCCGRANQRWNIPEGTAMWCSADCGWKWTNQKEHTIYQMQSTYIKGKKMSKVIKGKDEELERSVFLSLINLRLVS